MLLDLPKFALSVRQPWAWAIIHAGKDIENRSWQAVNRGLDQRGRIAVHAAKGIAQYTHRARRFGAKNAELDCFLLEALFVTVTNVNFDDAAIEKTIRHAIELRELAKSLYETAAVQAGKAVTEVRGPATWSPATVSTRGVSFRASPRRRRASTPRCW